MFSILSRFFTILFWSRNSILVFIIIFWFSKSYSGFHISILSSYFYSGLPVIMLLTLLFSNAEYYGPSLFLLATDVVTAYVFQVHR